jgi:hypothetical protein
VRRWPLTVVVVVALVAAPRAASAERLVMLSPPVGLTGAVEAALAGWPIEVVQADGEAGASMPAAGERARAVAEAESAGAVVWIASDGTGHAVWIFDRESGRVTARRLPLPPPFDEPTAAAVALTIKTLLRHSAVTPVLERYGVAAARAEIATEVRPPPAPPRFRLDTLAGARIRATEASDVELRLGAALRTDLPGRLSAVARIRSGTGVAVSEPDFIGRYTDLQASVGLMARFLARPALAIAPGLGASLHLTRIDGSIRSREARGEASRVNPSLDAGVAIEIDVGRAVRVSVGGEGSYALRRQVYLVGGDPVLTLPRFEAEIGAALSVALF